jgi:hypothetical protein
MKEINSMRRVQSIRILALTVVLTGAFVALRSAATPGEDNSCKGSMDQCCKKKNKGDTFKTNWENLSRQFFSSI